MSEDSKAMLMIAVVAIVYFLPAFIAVVRQHRNAVAIGALNVLLGWTFLGWVAALIWSLTASEKRRQVYRRF